MLADNQAWWSEFWSKAFVRLHSDDGQADFVERNYTYFLYVMASASRGAYMPHFNGMIWFTNGDMRQWGSQFWWHNQGCYYHGLTPANRPELLEPVFSTYSRRYDSFARAARQQPTQQHRVLGLLDHARARNRQQVRRKNDLARVQADLLQ